VESNICLPVLPGSACCYFLSRLQADLELVISYSVNSHQVWAVCFTCDELVLVK